MIEIGVPSKKQMTYDEAVLYVLTCEQNGHTDWRMPTDEEWVEHAPSVGPWAAEDDKVSEYNGELYVALPVRDI